MKIRSTQQRFIDQKTWLVWSWIFTALLPVFFTMANVSHAFAQSNDDACIVIDSDADLDDFRAVAALAPRHHVAAIVVTEGISRASEGAGAMEMLLKRGGLSIPVIVGATASTDRNYKPKSGLKDWRDNAERLNGILTEPVTSSSQPPTDIAATLKQYTPNCSRISLLVIGPWTSFMRYAPAFLNRVNQIVAQGRPDPDELGGEPSGFNCDYDLDSCTSAFDLLVGRAQRADHHLRTAWIDIPHSPQACGSAEPGVDPQGHPFFAFAPIPSWSEDLKQAGGMATVIGAILSSNPSGWARTSLWDDLTALYLLRPDIFAIRGGHMEPCVSAKTVRNLLTDYMAGK